MERPGSGAAVFQNGQGGGGAYPPPLSVFRRRCFRRPPDRLIGLYALMTVRSDAWNFQKFPYLPRKFDKN